MIKNKTKKKLKKKTSPKRVNSLNVFMVIGLAPLLPANSLTASKLDKI